MATPIFGVWPPPFNVGGSTAIGAPIIGGTPKAVLFVDAAGKLGQDPGFLDYDKALHQLQRNVTSDGSAFERVTPSGGGPSWYDRMGGATFGVTFDPVRTFGFNVGSAGQNLDPAFGAVYLDLEGSFQVDGNPAHISQEMHFIFVTTANNATRHLSMFRRQDTGHAEAAFTTDTFRVFDQVSGNPLLEVFNDGRFKESAHIDEWRVFDQSDGHELLAIFGAGTGNPKPIWALRSEAIPAGGADNQGLRFYATGIMLCAGHGAPTLNAPKGSIYMRDDGTGVNDRAYINTNGAATWTAMVTVA